MTALLAPLLSLAAPPAHAIGESFSVSNASIPEGSTSTNLTFTITLSAPAATMTSVNYATVDLTGTAKAKSTGTPPAQDFQAKTGTAEFPPGTTTQTVLVSVFGDNTPEPNEQMVLRLSNPSPGTITGTSDGTGTILNDDGTPPAVSIVSASAAEGNTGTTTTFGTNVLKLSKPSNQPVVVTYRTVNGTATTGDNDFVGVTSGTATFAPNTTETSAPVTVNGDGKVEANETFGLNITSVDNANVPSPTSTQTITNDDGLPAISVLPAGSVAEGAGTVTFTVSTDKPSTDTLLVDYATQDGTASSADYTPASGTLTFAPNETSKSVVVTIKQDTIQENSETFQLVLSSPTNATLGTASSTATITDDEAKPTASIADTTVTEGTGGTNNLSFTVTLSAPSALTTSVHYKTALDVPPATPAAENEDFTPVTDAILTFTAGETRKNIDINVVTDANDDAPNETLFVELDKTNEVGVEVADGSALGTITDDDATPSLTVVNAGTVTETNEGGTTATSPPFHVVLSHVSNRQITVNYATVDETATGGDDFAPVAGTLTFNPGSLRPTSNTCDAGTAPDACIPVTVFGDNLSEANETYGLHLSSPSNATAGADGHGTITDNDTAPVVSIANAGNVTETNGNTGNASFEVSLNTPSGRNTTVNYATADGTAKQPSDYTLTAGTLTFAAGETSKTVLVPIKGDAFPEPNESLTLGLTSPVGLTLGTTTGTATIVNDDGPAATLAIGNTSVTEGTGGTTNATFTVTLSGTPGQAVGVSYATSGGSATSGTDFTATSGALTFATGETSKTINVPVTTDSITEPTESFTVTLSNPNNANITTPTGTGTINDDDAAPVASINSTSLLEGDTGTSPATLTVTLNHPSSSTVTVNAATADASATTADADYVAKSATVTFVPGDTSETFVVTVNGDTNVEPTEALSAALSAPSGATLATGGGAIGTVTITDDDTPPVLSVDDVTIEEKTGGTNNATVTVKLTGTTSKTVGVDYATAPDTATADDFTATSGSLSFAPGETSKNVLIPITTDSLDENSESFAFNLSNASSATLGDGAAVVTITDDDDATPARRISISDVTLPAEGTGTPTVVNVPVKLDGPAASTVNVDFATAVGNATAADFTATSGTLTFAAGETDKTIPVTINPDALDEFNEKFSVNLTNATGATISDGTASVTITDDDATPTLTITDQSIAEGNSGTKIMTFTLSLSAPSGRAVKVTYKTTNGTAVSTSDYTAKAATTITFLAGQTTKSVTVAIKGDTVCEANETFTVDLSAPVNATLARTKGIGTITNDD